MSINFKTNTDTGANATEAIGPYQNGEAINATVMNRPVENLRARTEVIKSFLYNAGLRWDTGEHVTAYSQLNSALKFDGVYTGGARAAQGSAGSGVFYFDNPSDKLTIKPQNAPAATVYAHTTITDTINGGSIKLTAQPWRFMGSHNIGLRMVDTGRSTGSTIQVTMLGEDTVWADEVAATPQTMRKGLILVDYQSGATVADLLTVFASPVSADEIAASDLVTITAVSADTLGLWDTDDYEFLSDGQDAVQLDITAVALTTALDTDTNALQAGDLLYIDFESDRHRNACVVETGNTDISASMIKNSRADAPSSDAFVPLARVIADSTVALTNHATVTAGTETYLNTHNWATILSDHTRVNEFIKMGGLSFLSTDGTGLTDTLQELSDKVDTDVNKVYTDLADAAQGADLVTMPAGTVLKNVGSPGTWAEDTVTQHIRNLYGLVIGRASTGGASFSGPVTISPSFGLSTDSVVPATGGTTKMTVGGTGGISTYAVDTTYLKRDSEPLRNAGQYFLGGQVLEEAGGTWTKGLAGWGTTDVGNVVARFTLPPFAAVKSVNWIMHLYAQATGGVSDVTLDYSLIGRYIDGSNWTTVTDPALVDVTTNITGGSDYMHVYRLPIDVPETSTLRAPLLNYGSSTGGVGYGWYEAELQIVSYTGINPNFAVHGLYVEYYPTEW